MADKLKVFKNSIETIEGEGTVDVCTVPANGMINIKNFSLVVDNTDMTSTGLEAQVKLDGIMLDSSVVSYGEKAIMNVTNDVIAEAGNVIEVDIIKTTEKNYIKRPIVLLDYDDYKCGYIQSKSVNTDASTAYDRVAYVDYANNIWNTAYTPDYACMALYEGTYYTFHTRSNTEVIIMPFSENPSSSDGIERTSVFPAAARGLTTDNVYLYARPSGSTTDLYRVAISDLINNTYSGNVETLTLDTSINAPSGHTNAHLFEYYDDKIYSIAQTSSSTVEYHTTYTIDLETLAVTSLNDTFLYTSGFPADDTYYTNMVLSVTKDDTPYAVFVGAGTTDLNIYTQNLVTGEVSLRITETDNIGTTSIRRLVDLGEGLITYTKLANTTTEADMTGATYDLNTDTYTDKTTWLGGSYYMSHTSNDTAETLLLTIPIHLITNIKSTINIHASGVESIEV